MERWIGPIFDKMQEIFKPLVDAGIEKIVNMINSPWFQEALYDLKKLFRFGKQRMNQVANLFNIGTDEEKIVVYERVRDEIIDYCAKLTLDL